MCMIVTSNLIPILNQGNIYFERKVVYTNQKMHETCIDNYTLSPLYILMYFICLKKNKVQ